MGYSVKLNGGYMYNLAYRIFSGNKLIRYKLLNIDSRIYETKLIGKTVNLTQQGLVQNLKYTLHRLQGNNIL